MNKKNNIIWLVLTLLGMTIACPVQAVKYKVLYSNSTNVRIGGQTVKAGMQFDEKDKIVWTSEDQALKVMDLSTKRIKIIAAKALNKKGVATLADYLHKVSHLSTRGYGKETIVVDTVCYMLDTLKIHAGPHHGNQMKDEAIIDVNGDSEITAIKKSSDKKEFILTRDMFARRRSKVAYVDIRETDSRNNWQYYIYKRLRVEMLPLKTDNGKK